MTKYMKKIILSVAVALSFSVLMPTILKAGPMIEIIDNMDIELPSVTISINHNVLHVCGAAGQTLQIYKVTGVGVMSVVVDSDDRYYTLDLAKGCYIVKIGKIARKISIV